MSEPIDDERWNEESWAWARSRMPKAPRSIHELTLDALDRGFCCDKVEDWSVVLRRFPHFAGDTGTIITAYYQTARNGRPGRFTGAKVEKVVDLDYVKKRADAVQWVGRFEQQR